MGPEMRVNDIIVFRENVITDNYSQKYFKKKNKKKKQPEKWAKSKTNRSRFIYSSVCLSGLRLKSSLEKFPVLTLGLFKASPLVLSNIVLVMFGLNFLVAYTKSDRKYFSSQNSPVVVAVHKWSKLVEIKKLSLEHFEPLELAMMTLILVVVFDLPWNWQWWSYLQYGTSM